ncbi:MAG TPA: sialidase family protein [Chloroflexota bacterium]|nr:sialidase family protein [Chloroflexota bacterium]
MSTMNAATPALHLTTLAGWYRFERAGDTWAPAGRALTYWSASCLAVDPADPRVVYVGSERSGLFVSRDAGAHWERPQPNVPRLSLFSLLAVPGALLAGTIPAALYRGDARGGRWEELEDVRRGGSKGSFPPNPDLGTRTRYLARDPNDPERLYAGIEVGGLLLSDDGGATWRPANEGLSDPDVHQVRPAATRPGLVVAACGEGVFRSEDRAEHWQEVTPPGGRTYGMAVAEDRDGAWYLGITRGRPNTWLREERADGAILRSADGGATWKTVVEGLRGGVMDLCAAPEGAGVLAATSEGEVLAVDAAGCRTLLRDLPCITALAMAA